MKQKNQIIFSFLLMALVVFVSACAVSKNPSVLEQQDKNTANNKQKIQPATLENTINDKKEVRKEIRSADLKYHDIINDKKALKSTETRYHFFFDKFFKEEELTEDEKQRYENNIEDIMSLFVNTEKIQNQCIEKAMKVDKQFGDEYLGKHSIVYINTGLDGIQRNSLLLLTIKSYLTCINENEGNIQEIAIYNKQIYDALLSERNAGTRIFQEKEKDKELCDKAELNPEQKTLCRTIDKNYLIDLGEKAYKVSLSADDKKKTEKDIEQEIDNFMKANKQIQELEGWK